MFCRVLISRLAGDCDPAEIREVNMGLRFPTKIHGNCFFITTTFDDRNEYGKIKGMHEGISKSLAFNLSKYSARMIAFVLMPSHLHMILAIDGSQLSNFMRDFKKFVAQKTAKECGISAEKIWVRGYDSVALFSEKVFRQKLEYIHYNPVKAGLVETAEDWEWSSAGAYLLERDGLIPVWKDWSW